MTVDDAPAAVGPALDDPAVPRIDPVPPGVDRPTWSVMIPSYNAGAFLEQALRSVLDQDPGPDRMQIAVVDDASPGADRAEAIVRRLATGRVEFHRAPENLGLAGNWNRCIGMARGRWVHLLHQDDWVLPGFFDRLGRAGDAGPSPVAAFCRYRVVDGRGEVLRVPEPEREGAGPIDDLLGRLATGLCIQCPSIVAARSSYERLGGFRSDLCYALDWEMWARMAASGPFWYEPEVLSCYRSHVGNESSRLVRAGADLADAERCLELILRRLPEADRPALRRRAGTFLGMLAMSGAVALMDGGHWRPGLSRLRRAGRLDPRWDTPDLRRGFRRWAVKIWASRLLRSAGGGAPRRGPSPP